MYYVLYKIYSDTLSEWKFMELSATFVYNSLPKVYKVVLFVL